MSEMVERVARALVIALNPAINPNDELEWAITWELKGDQCAMLARAAIAAMREPTSRQADAVIDADMDIYWSYRADGSPGEHKDVWRVMIDAALSD